MEIPPEALKREFTKDYSKFYLAIHIETKDDTLEVPMGDKDSFQVRTDGIYLEGKLTFWEDIICVLLVPKWDK